jgi:HEAT repeat protein
MRRTMTALAAIAAAMALAATGGRAGDERHGGPWRPPSEVVRPPDGAAALQARFDWALGQAAKAGSGKALWVGYSVEKLMSERSFIGSYDSRRFGLELTVADILAGRKTPAAAGETGDVRSAAKAVLDDLEARRKPERKVLKELGFFFKYEAGGKPALVEVGLANLDSRFDFEAAPLYWLGKGEAGESVPLIERLYAQAGNDEAREGLLAAAGCHDAPALAVPFLAKVLGGDGPVELRKNAAFWIGQQNDAKGLDILARAARADRSEEVREGAVFAISQVELPKAVDELIALAKGADKTDVRKQAVFWIGQLASEKAAPALEEFARKDGDIEIQEQAVFALSQLEGNQGVEPLIKLAKTHPDPRIRKKAIFWLGECDDPRALETLIAIIKK